MEKYILVKSSALPSCEETGKNVRVMRRVTTRSEKATKGQFVGECPLGECPLGCVWLPLVASHLVLSQLAPPPQPVRCLLLPPHLSMLLYSRWPSLPALKILPAEKELLHLPLNPSPSNRGDVFSLTFSSCTFVFSELQLPCSGCEEMGTC